jgi:hypothetical protein
LTNRFYCGILYLTVEIPQYYYLTKGEKYMYWFLIVGIVGLIANANSWFVVPDIAIYICFGLSLFMFIVRFITTITVNEKLKRW